MPFLNIFSNKKSQKINLPTITIDHREKNALVISELMKRKFPIEFKQLPIADYIINNIAIVRKTISDLKSSIIDKRIFSQLLELKQYPKHFLIIEGDQEELYSGVLLHENASRGFLLAVALEYQVPIIFSSSPQETAQYIEVLAKKKDVPLSIRPTKIFRNKKEQLQFILEGFPHVGPTKAKALIKKFKSLSNIINASIEELSPILGSRAEEFKSLIN